MIQVYIGLSRDIYIYIHIFATPSPKDLPFLCKAVKFVFEQTLKASQPRDLVMLQIM